MSRLHIPIPLEITDGTFSKKCEKTYSSEYDGIIEKLKNATENTNEKAIKKSKSFRKLRNRVSFVLNHDSNDSKNSLEPLKQVIDLDMNESYVTFGITSKNTGDIAAAKSSALLIPEERRKEIDQAVPKDETFEIQPKLGKKALKKKKKLEREKTKGGEWFNMPATEITDEIKNDLEVLKMRGALDPKRFYKKNASNELPKYFQVGRYVDNPVEFYNDRGTSKKKKTLVDELMADAEFQRYNKRKYTEIIVEKSKHMNKKDQKIMAKRMKMK